MNLRLLIGLAVLVALAGVSACRQAPESPEMVFYTFTATYTLDSGRNYSITGPSNGMPGEQSEYILRINNNDDRWQDEYYVLLVDSDSMIQEIRHCDFNIPGKGCIQEPLTVEFPEDFTGALGLCVVIPQHGCLISTLSIGVDNAIATGWPDIPRLVEPAKTGS